MNAKFIALYTFTNWTHSCNQYVDQETEHYLKAFLIFPVTDPYLKGKHYVGF